VEVVTFFDVLKGQVGACPQVLVVQMVVEILLVYQMAMVWDLHVAQEDIHFVGDQTPDLMVLRIAAVVDIVDSCLIHREF
jgi:hypothetical protein